MMLPTHAVVGVAIAAPLVRFAPELAPIALAGGLAGGIFPDLDMYAGHRKTLHYPTVFAILTLPTALLAVIYPQPVIVGAAFFIFGAAAHCQMDRFGGGLELEPWKATSEKAVYDHVRGRWRRPKRWISYDGSPQDLALLTAVALPLVVVLDDPFRAVVVIAWLIGAIYTALRRRLASIAPIVFGFAPQWLVEYVPERYQPKTADGS